MKKILDIIIQFLFVTGFLYAAYQLFFVFKNPAGGLVLWGDAAEIDVDLVIIRRLYALEFWLIFLGYFIYLAIRPKIYGEAYSLSGRKD